MTFSTNVQPSRFGEGAVKPKPKECCGQTLAAHWKRCPACGRKL